MPWNEVSVMGQREEFVRLADESNVRLLCRRFGVSPTTAYKWFERYRAGGREGLMDLSRRPHHSPSHSGKRIEQAVVALRGQHPAWGARKLRHRLLAKGVAAVPATSTVHAILRRHNLIDPTESAKHKAWQRFEHDAPNRLWQMDFKGHFPTQSIRCHPLTVLDDHSRFAKRAARSRSKAAPSRSQKPSEATLLLSDPLLLATPTTSSSVSRKSLRST